MPVFESSQTFPRPPDEVFDFFCRPADVLAASPPELHLRLDGGPERLALGARVTVRGRRWGVPHRITTEVTAFEPGVLLVEEQRQGPFRRWVHTHRFEAVACGTRVSEGVEFEPPGGLLGLTVTAASVLRDLEWAFAYRKKRLEEFLGQPGESATG